MTRGRVALWCGLGCAPLESQLRLILETEGWRVVDDSARCQACVALVNGDAGEITRMMVIVDKPVVVVLTGGDPEPWIAAGLRNVLIFPPRPQDLSARLTALAGQQRDSRVTIGPISIDLGAREVSSKGEVLPFTRLEAEYFCYLAEHRGEWTHGRLLEQRLHGLRNSDGGASRVLVHAIRKKLGTDAWVLETKRGYGYRLAQRSPRVGAAPEHRRGQGG